MLSFQERSRMHQLYCSHSEQMFFSRPTYILNENNVYVPRFSIKNPEIFKDFPTNEPMRYSPELIQRAISYGMIIEIDYRGEEDVLLSGHNRVIYPMVLGTTKKNKEVIRGWHFKGWSVSKGGNIEKEWRMFRTDRILNMSFTGSFYRLAPEGYNARDKGMNRIIAAADFNVIRNNQQILLQQHQIDSIDRTILKKVGTMEVKTMHRSLTLNDPFSQNIPEKDARNIRVTFAKPLLNERAIVAIIGISIEPNTRFKLKIDNLPEVQYKAVKWVMGNELKGMGPVDGQNTFASYMFIKTN